MAEIGYALSSEEHPPKDLVRFAQRAEDSGFSFAAISDHYHPWVDAQGQSPFVWSVIGGIATTTSSLNLGTGVTCPTFRIHPAIIAQAAATASAMMPGRFFLGVGSGENLNEHILGDHWPPPPVRQDMLAEAVAVIRQLWEGGYQSFDGQFFTVENARIYTLPQELPAIVMAAAGPSAAELAGQVADGMWSVAPDAELVSTYEQAGGTGPRYGQVKMCWAADQDEARKTVSEWWPNAGIGGELSQELPLPRHFEQAAALVTPDDLAEKVPMGPDPEQYVEQVKAFVDAGFTHVYLHQIGPDQEGFFDFFRRELAPRL
ncbi:MAG TPA: TIGR03557 family F420-dependent LLM class oxidoreductase [Acidimicrobiales bacterium]|jgi:coenzyme F420-dependent glucose-6-phosphate dehydrogenase|nr:TIGR03557 family F420-dependent LLM class oxidoreductase [Acidimicrobiales bacterium]